MFTVPTVCAIKRGVLFPHSTALYDNIRKRSRISSPKSSQTKPNNDFKIDGQPSRDQLGTSLTDITQRAVTPAMMSQVKRFVCKPANEGIALSDGTQFPLPRKPSWAALPFQASFDSPAFASDGRIGN